MEFEIFKARDDLSPEIINEFFELKEPSISLCSQGYYFLNADVKTIHYGIQSIKYLVPKIWDLVPDQIKLCVSLTKCKISLNLGHQVTVLKGYPKRIAHLDFI